MPKKALKPCLKTGCNKLTRNGYCDEHKKELQKHYDKQRGSAHERGYDSRWRRYSKWFLSQPENVLCKLQLPGCTRVANCVDHIDPPDGPDDPRFWNPNNHQGACIHCNSVKGHRLMEGRGVQ